MLLLMLNNEVKGEIPNISNLIKKKTTKNKKLSITQKLVI